MTRLPVKKTYKLYVGGAFPRSESGRTYEAEGQNVARASRKDVRDAIRAARAAFPVWSGMTAYNRGQVLYRLAEMLEARATDLAAVCSGREGGRGCDRSRRLVRGLVGQAVRRCSAARIPSPARTSTSPFPSRPASSPCSPRSSRRSPASCRGSFRRSSAETPSSWSRRRSTRCAAIELAEALATSDVPGGAVNILTGFREELAPWLAAHMDVNAIDLTGADGDLAELERLAADNVKRVVRSTADAQSPWEIESFLELKTVWHPIGL